MNRISIEVSIFCLWTYWIYRATCSKRDCVSYTTAVAAPLTKAVKFALPILVYTKNQFWLAATRKKRIRKQLNFFETCVLNPFHGQKIKENFFFREVERTALSESGASRSSEAFQILLWDTRNLDFSIFLFCIFMNFHSHCPSFNKYYIF